VQDGSPVISAFLPDKCNTLMQKQKNMGTCPYLMRKKILLFFFF